LHNQSMHQEGLSYTDAHSHASSPDQGPLRRTAEIWASHHPELGTSTSGAKGCRLENSRTQIQATVPISGTHLLKSLSVV
jgi:hypothetical protein